MEQNLRKTSKRVFEGGSSQCLCRFQAGNSAWSLEPSTALFGCDLGHPHLPCLVYARKLPKPRIFRKPRWGGGGMEEASHRV